MTYQFQTLEADWHPSSVHTDFMEAWHDMYHYVNGLLKAGQLSLQVLETSIWIEMTENGVKQPIFFYDARDLAIVSGWILPE
jgi:hypothetical protein